MPTCEICGKVCTNNAGLASHKRIFHKISKSIKQSDEAIQAVERFHKEQEKKDEVKTNVVTEARKYFDIDPIIEDLEFERQRKERILGLRKIADSFNTVKIYK